MKKHFLPLVAAIALFACNNNDLKNVQPAGPKVTHSSARTWMDCNYNVQTDEHGNKCCKSPWADCALIRHDSPVSFDDMDQAIAKGPGAVQAFFNGDWQKTFPCLPDNPSLIESLKNGSNTMVRDRNSDGDVFYHVVPAAKGSAYKMSDIIYTSMLAHQ